MSSVSSKSTSGQDERVQNARDEYKKKEAELVKKHNREIKALSDRYKDDLSNREVNYNNNISHVKEKTQESLTKKDAKYQNEISEMKALHAKQIERLRQESLAQSEITKKAAENEVKHEKLGRSDQLQSLHKRYDQQHEDESQKFSDGLSDIREKSRKNLDEIRDKMRESHDKEKGYMRDERNETVARLKLENRDIDRSARERLKTQDQRHVRDKAKSQAAHMDTIRRENEAHNEVLENTREGFDQSLGTLRKDMQRAYQKEKESQANITGAFHADVEDRIDTQVNRLERDLAKARNNSITSKQKAKIDAQREIEQMKDAYQQKFEHLENSRQETVRQSNDINADNLRKVKAQSDKMLIENARFNKSKSEIENFRNKTAFEAAKEDFKIRQNYIKENSDMRVENVIKDTNDKERSLRANFQDNIEMLKDTSVGEKREMLTKLEKEKAKLSEFTKKKMIGQEITHQRKLNDLVSNYETKMKEINEVQIREKRAREQREKELVKNMNRQKQSEIDAVQIKHADQMRAAELAHEEEMKALARRNQEKIDEILKSVKRNS